MGNARTWIAGLGVSALVHVGIAAGFSVIYDPKPPPDQTGAASSILMETHVAPIDDAIAQEPEGQTARESQGDQPRLGAAALTESKAAPVKVKASKAQAISPSSQPVSDLPTTSSPVGALRPVAKSAPSVDVNAATLADIIPTQVSVRTSPLPAAEVMPTSSAPARVSGISPIGEQPKSIAPQGARAVEAALPAENGVAALAWQFSDRIVTDPKAIATIQAFMSPETLDDAQEVRDDLASVLGGIDCARISATYIPETGALELRGHVPDPALALPLMESLQNQVGEGIEVVSNLLHLPSPQCGALSGIAAAGLPQSTDQFTNSRLVGAHAQARDYAFNEGQRLQFDLTAPDYDAFVYVDYFSADGQVIHLVPNDTIALERQLAKSSVGVGTDRIGKPSLRLTIGPPFGQEIAAAFAASHLLFDELRPISEPAESYLRALKDSVAEAREAHPDFKGEWVYFFITTSPATQ